MPVEISGLGDLEDAIHRLVDRVESIGGEVPIEELFPEDFMRAYSEFKSFEEFIQESKWEVQTQEDFEEIPEEEFDEYVDTHTGFNDWETMLEAAGREYVMRQLHAEQ